MFYGSIQISMPQSPCQHKVSTDSLWKLKVPTDFCQLAPSTDNASREQEHKDSHMAEKKIGYLALCFDVVIWFQII